MKLRFTREALVDLDCVLGYIGTRSPAGARNVKARILESIGALKRFPGIGTVTDDGTTRMLVATPYPYLIFYEVDAGAREVVILHIRHGARDRDG